MHTDEISRRSRFILRVMEWDEPRARYPNIWQEGMPRHVEASRRLAGRLRLGDLIAVFHPSSTRHPARSERFVGIARVAGLRASHRADHAWIDLETAHRFEPPLDVGRPPQRVFLCCDRGWPESEAELFERVFDAAVQAGWAPLPEEREVLVASPPIDRERAETARPARPPRGEAASKPPAPTLERGRPVEQQPAWAAQAERVFAGAAYSGAMRDPRDRTWLAVVGLYGVRLRVLRLEPTGRSGLQALLRNPDRALMRAEAVGLGFPFGLPLPFAESLLGGPFPEEGWWALPRRLEQITWPDYLIALQEFRDAHGEVPRATDELRGTLSPLHRVEPDLGSRSYHGIRMIAEDRSRYAIRPFESAQGRRLLEVSPSAALARVVPSAGAAAPPLQAAVQALPAAERWPTDLDASARSACLVHREALDAVVAARCAAIAVLTDEADRSPEQLAGERASRVRREGWIYGIQGE